MTNTVPKTEKIHCNSCSQNTKHQIIATREQSGTEDVNEEFQIWWSDTYDLFECLGCEAITLRCKSTFSEWEPNEFKVDYYPPRIGRRAPIWKKALRSEIQELLNEVYTALQANSRRIAIMGCRAIIDMVIVDQVGDVGTFAQKLVALESAGFLSKSNRDVLDAALEAGNAVSHRGLNPSDSTVNQIMDIVENLLQSILLHKEAKTLKRSTPKRKKARVKKKP